MDSLTFDAFITTGFSGAKQCISECAFEICPTICMQCKFSQLSFRSNTQFFPISLMLCAVRLTVCWTKNWIQPPIFGAMWTYNDSERLINTRYLWNPRHRQLSPIRQTILFAHTSMLNWTPDDSQAEASLVIEWSTTECKIQREK